MLHMRFCFNFHRPSTCVSIEQLQIRRQDLFHRRSLRGLRFLASRWTAASEGRVEVKIVKTRSKAIQINALILDHPMGAQPGQDKGRDV